jgi:hypothetical protein
MAFGFEPIQKEKERKCICGFHPYSGRDCICGRGRTFEELEASNRYWDNFKPVYDIILQAKGLIYLNADAFVSKNDKLLTVYWKKATEAEKQKARELWRSGYRPRKSLTK